MQYYKFSDERNKKYSIKTTIIETDNEKFVEKAPIYPEGMEHLRNVCAYHDILEKAYPEISICPVEMQDNKIVFDYVEGSLLLDEYQKCMDLDDEDAFSELLKKHYRMICGSENNIGIFEETEKSKKWFGNMDIFSGKPCLKIANFDATPGNIVVGDKTSFIDYEWVFDCGIPVDLAVYHCVGDAYIHIENLEKFVPIEKAMHILGVFTPIEKMKAYYESFYRYVLEETEDICFAEKKFECLKPMNKIADMKDELANAKVEWEKTASNWKASCKDNEALNQKINELLHENAKLAQYWKDSCAKYREPTVEATEMNSLRQSIIDKDNHIRNIEAMLEESRNQYNQIVTSKRWRIVAKIARIFNR